METDRNAGAAAERVKAKLATFGFGRSVFEKADMHRLRSERTNFERRKRLVSEDKNVYVAQELRVGSNELTPSEVMTNECGARRRKVIDEDPAILQPGDNAMHERVLVFLAFV